jgi:hypothetical protein
VVRRRAERHWDTTPSSRSRQLQTYPKTRRVGLLSAFGRLFQTYQYVVRRYIVRIEPHPHSQLSKQDDCQQELWHFRKYHRCWHHASFPNERPVAPSPRSRVGNSECPNPASSGSAYPKSVSFEAGAQCPLCRDIVLRWTPDPSGPPFPLSYIRSRYLVTVPYI